MDLLIDINMTVPVICDIASSELQGDVLFIDVACNSPDWVLVIETDQETLRVRRENTLASRVPVKLPGGNNPQEVLEVYLAAGP